MAREKRWDDKRVVLRVGEGQRENGMYYFRWKDSRGKRRYVYAKTLTQLREKEKQIQKDKLDGIKAEARYTTVNEVYDLWKGLKRGLKDNTFANYQYMYETFVRQTFGKERVSEVKKSDVKRFYNHLADVRKLKASTIDSVHTVLHQIFNMAVDDDYIRSNPTDNVLRELKKSHVFKYEKKRALTKQQEELFLNYLRNHSQYKHWYPIFAVMAGTGMRMGEVIGLRWEDLDFDAGIIDVNHTLVYYQHRTENAKNGCYHNIHTPKTLAGVRQVPMLGTVKEAFLLEKQYQEELGVECTVVIDGYSNFVFLNRFGNVHNQSTLNGAIRRVIRDCNDEQLLCNETPDVLLPPFSCHTLRHTFATRMCEAGMNIKVMQDVLGHQDISTTMNIYTDVTRELKEAEFASFEENMNSSRKQE